MASLDDAQKRFIVRRLACFVAQVDVIAEFETEFNVKLTADQVSSYDATTRHGQDRMGQELQDLFTETREKYTKDEDSIPLAHRAFRVNWLTDMLLRNPKVQRSANLQMAVLEQAAKEMGGQYVRHKLEDKGGATNALMELRTLLGVPLTAADAGPVEAKEREERRQLEREQEVLEAEARLAESSETVVQEDSDGSPAAD